MASMAQVDKSDHLESGEASPLQYAWRSTILHMWGLFQTVIYLQAKAILQEYPEPMPHVNDAKGIPNSLVLQCARPRGFGKSRWVLGLEEPRTEHTR